MDITGSYRRPRCHPLERPSCSFGPRAPSEIRYGSFARVLPLPASADESDIKASYVDGILEVRAPLDQERSKRSRIPISRDRNGQQQTLGTGGQPATGPTHAASTGPAS
jgi:HSP20 family protein